MDGSSEIVMFKVIAIMRFGKGKKKEGQRKRSQIPGPVRRLITKKKTSVLVTQVQIWAQYKQ